MIEKDSLSIIIPALNEAKNLEATVNLVSEAAKMNFKDYEILIFNDGSSDQTGLIAERLAAKDKHLKVFHSKAPKCLGGVYKRARQIAKMDYLILVNGKCDTSIESLNKIFAFRGKADMIIPYTININERPILRRIISFIFVWLLNIIFNLKLKYYNHYVLHRKKIVNSIEIDTNSYAFQAEILIKLIKAGCSYIEVGINDNFQKGVKTKAFKWNNFKGVVLFIFKAIRYVYLKKFNLNLGF